MHKNRLRRVPEKHLFLALFGQAARSGSVLCIAYAAYSCAYIMIKAQGLSTPTFPHCPQGYPQFSGSKALIFGPSASSPVENLTPKSVFPPVETALQTSYMTITSLFTGSTKGHHFVGKGLKMSEKCRVVRLKRRLFLPSQGGAPRASRPTVIFGEGQ
jgi:hypothetical protein